MIPVRIFFATDIHGSEICWRKFLNAASFYKADLVILGGDVTGKAMVPITAHNGYWQVVFGGETRRIETREELEIRISDYEICKLILERLGFVQIFRYEKYRTEFRRPGDTGVVMLDETPIGAFLELEGKASWIDQVAETLGYPASQYIIASYGALYLEYCRTRSVVPEDMVFS